MRRQRMQPSQAGASGHVAQQFDVVVAGELNVDLILSGLDSLPEIGKEKLAKEMTLTMGSASAITACALARLGLGVGFVGKVGNDNFGSLVLDSLRKAGVDCSHVSVDSRSRTGITVSLSFPDNYAMVTYMGAMAEFRFEEIDLDYLGKAGHLHLSSYYLQPQLRSSCAELFSRAKAMGLTTSLDPGWDPSEEWGKDLFAVLEYTDIFLPNEEEVLRITRTAGLLQAFRALERYCRVIVVKRGRKGAVCWSDGELIERTAYPVRVVDTTGAGDCFNAGFLQAWLEGSDLRRCMKMATACGALATTRLGGASSLPSRQEVEQFLLQRSEVAASD